MMYDNLSNRLRGESEVSDASPYIKELMRQAADALDHFEKAFQNISEHLNKTAPTIIPASEEVYDKYTDTVGNFHWTGTKSGAHTIPAEEGE